MENQLDSSLGCRDRIAVIGAGISGLTCANQLHQQGYSVTLYDKGRGVGGRMSTRRAEQFEFDHGCQFIEASDSRFQQALEYWEEKEIIREWKGAFGTLDRGNFVPELNHVQRFVGIPRMNSICKKLSEGLDLHLEFEVVSLSHSNSQWEITTKNGIQSKFDSLIVSSPAAQAANLLKGVLPPPEQFVTQNMTGCWTVMAVFSTPPGIDCAGALVKDSPLTWIADNSSKPLRPQKYKSWVLQAEPDWSSKFLEADGNFVCEQLLEAFSDATQCLLPKIEFISAHRWRYANPMETLRTSYFYDSQLALGFCGDWCNQPSVQGAYLSGLELSDHISNSS